MRLTLIVCGAVLCTPMWPQDARTASSVQAFQRLATVFQHPRCLNCHVPDDHPRQGDDSHVHTMGVERGADGGGAAYLRCSTCHQDRNLEGEHTPPGAGEGWRMPGLKTRMSWVGLSTRQLCEAVKDPKTNGNRSGNDLIQHASSDLVRWAFSPGGGRTPPPLTHEEFVAATREWIEGGQACPTQ